MSDEGGVMPSDVRQEVTPREVTPTCGQRGSRRLAGTKAAQPWTLSQDKLVTAVMCRAGG